MELIHDFAHEFPRKRLSGNLMNKGKRGPELPNPASSLTSLIRSHDSLDGEAVSLWLGLLSQFLRALGGIGAKKYREGAWKLQPYRSYRYLMPTSRRSISSKRCPPGAGENPPDPTFAVREHHVITHVLQVEGRTDIGGRVENER